MSAHAHRAPVRALAIDAADNVATVLSDVESGQAVMAEGPCGSLDLAAAEFIPAFHKVALSPIELGGDVVKYGEFIGKATRRIAAGEHVHVHNCASSDALREEALKHALAKTGKPCLRARSRRATPSMGPGHFMGYVRPDGSVGVRNLVLVLPASVCASDVCGAIASRVKGCVSFHNQNGCSQVDADRDLTLKTLAGLAANPNVHSVLVVSLGCEGCQADLVVDAIAQRSDKPVKRLVIQEVGGVERALELGIAAAQQLVAMASQCHREPCPISSLVLGTNCGGSDATSGLVSNPLIGLVSDWVVAEGGTSVLCETPELFGAEQVLVRRAKTPKVAEELLCAVHGYESYVESFGAQMREGNPSPGNIAGGITTLEEKSLGCVHKGGISELSAVYPYAAKVEMGKGLVVVDTPGNDASSVVGLVAGGCQVVLFSTGLGTPTGNPLVPVLRLTANPRTAQTMADCTDFDASGVLEGADRMEELARSLEGRLLEVCSGEQTLAERRCFTEIALPHLCNYM